MGFSRQVPDVVGIAVEALSHKRHVRLNISLSELVRDRALQGKQITADAQDNLFRAMLYKYGIDITKHFEIEVCEHRNVFGEVVHCPYVLGIERTDTRWTFIKNGLVTGTWKL